MGRNGQQAFRRVEVFVTLEGIRDEVWANDHGDFHLALLAAPCYLDGKRSTWWKGSPLTASPKPQPPAEKQFPPSAQKIHDALHQQVVGQSGSKRQLATLLAMHLAWFSRPDLLHTAPNALMLGPSGVGKTHAIRTAAQALQIPLIIVDATRLSPQGYQGTSLENVLEDLLSASRKLINSKSRKFSASDIGLRELDELEVARRGVVFIDEFDKLSHQRSATAERSELLQRRLLEFVDGTSITLNPRSERGEKEIVFDTAGLLFVASGAFTNLLADSNRRSQAQMRSMPDHGHVIVDDLVRFGFLKELMARFPVIIEFQPLASADLVGIMENESVDPSIFYVEYLRSLGVELIVEDSAREYVAVKAAELGLGARGLHQVLFPILAVLCQQLEETMPSTYTLSEKTVRELIRDVQAGRRG